MLWNNRVVYEEEPFDRVRKGVRLLSCTLTSFINGGYVTWPAGLGRQGAGHSGTGVPPVNDEIMAGTAMPPHAARRGILSIGLDPVEFSLTG